METANGDLETLVAQQFSALQQALSYNEEIARLACPALQLRSGAQRSRALSSASDLGGPLQKLQHELQKGVSTAATGHEAKDPCTSRMPVVGDQVVVTATRTSKDGLWSLDPDEVATVIFVDNDGDFCLRNPSGAESNCVFRKHYYYHSKQLQEHSSKLSLTEPLLGGRHQSSGGGAHAHGRSSSSKRTNGKSSKVNSDRNAVFFPKLTQIRSCVGEALNKHNYRVEDFYFDTGCAQKIVRSRNFNNFMLAIIVANTFWIAIDTDLNKAEPLSRAPLLFQVVDNFFCCVFAFEITMRFMAFRTAHFAMNDCSFCFDFLLVACMVWETWCLVLLYCIFGDSPGGQGSKASSIFRIFRIFRLSRVARTARLLNSIPELMILAKGMMIAVRSVLSILFLLTLVIYIFAIMFTQLLDGTEVGEGKFGNVPQAMNFLLLQVLCGFDATVVNDMRSAGLVYYFLFLIFLLLASLTIMNMLIGILCDVVSTVASVEKDEAFVRELDSQVMDLAYKLDKRCNGTITESEFVEVTRNPVLTQCLDDLGVDVVGITDYATFIFSQVEELSYQDFQLMVSQFRGAKGVTVKDMMDMRKYVALELSYVKEHIGEFLDISRDNSR